MSLRTDKKLLQSEFTRELRRLNDYSKGRLQKWLFEPGMRFGDTDKWWQPGTTRARPHEGLDLLVFLDKRGDKHFLPAGTAIPPMLSGIEVARIPDFMGETVILSHDLKDESGRRLHTFYAHLQPAGILANGLIVETNSQLGKIAEPKKVPQICPPHLHLSLAWVDECYPIQDFRWDRFCEDKIFIPDDPLTLLQNV